MMSSRRSKRRRRKRCLTDDEFSKELKQQGKDGARLAMLYLSNPIEFYKKRILDEPIHY